MKVIVTCGPSYEPVDQTRRLTNFSTGAIGTMLSEKLTEAGFDVICCRGIGSTFRPPEGVKELTHFATNEELESVLQELHADKSKANVEAVFHAAALTDFKISKITDEDGVPLTAAKIKSTTPGIIIKLEPAGKVITNLRTLFPDALIVGWKYELDGTKAEAIQKARRQIRENQIDTCIVNGAAYGPGYGFCSMTEAFDHFPDKTHLCDSLVKWLVEATTAKKAKAEKKS